MHCLLAVLYKLRGLTSLRFQLPRQDEAQLVGNARAVANERRKCFLIDS